LVDHFHQDLERWERVIKAAGVKAE